MSRLLQYFNFLGVVALAVLCIIQWQADSRLTARTAELDGTVRDQSARIAEQDKTIKGNAVDLEELHKRLATSDAAQKETEARLATATIERAEAIKAREQAKAAIETRWLPAIAERDNAIKQGLEQVEKARAERADAVARYNDLTAKYNLLMQEWNAKAGH